MPYKCEINTSRYRPRRASKRNWEPGTVNDFMAAMNGWHHTEPNLQCLKWRLMMFEGVTPYDEEEYFSEGYRSWKAQPCNTITYLDKLCGFERTSEICPPGFKQGAGLRIDALITALLKEGHLEIPFSRVYDARQYDRHMDGCVLIITKK